MIKNYALALLTTFLTTSMVSQNTKQVFFIGNSYTATENIPGLIQHIANEASDQLIYQEYTPGGAKLQQHAVDANVKKVIDQGNWDYVVLQEQSQLPSFPPVDVNNLVAPYARMLSQQIKNANPCTEITFYMTWGRKYGDASNCPMWPPVCTYTGMDNLISNTYVKLANDNKGIISPVGAVWRYLINNYPQYDLYSGDESHPSTFGAMASAYTFYTVFFKKDPHSSNFAHTLPHTELAAIQEAVYNVVYNDMDKWYLFRNSPNADFTFDITDTQVAFTDYSQNAESHYWDFGDGNTDTSASPTHTYQDPGSYTVTLTITKCGQKTSLTKQIQIQNLSLTEHTTNALKAYPNPASDVLNILTDLTLSEFKVIDNTGRSQIVSGILNQTGYSIDISYLAAGKYILECTGSKDQQRIPFIKK